MQWDSEIALKTGIYWSSTKHLLNISLVCLPCLHTARPRVAAHIECAGGMRGNTLKMIDIVFLKSLSQWICWFITRSAATHWSSVYHMIRKNSVKQLTAFGLAKILIHLITYNRNKIRNVINVKIADMSPTLLFCCLDSLLLTVMCQVWACMTISWHWLHVRTSSFITLNWFSRYCPELICLRGCMNLECLTLFT